MGRSRCVFDVSPLLLCSLFVVHSTITKVPLGDSHLSTFLFYHHLDPTIASNTPSSVYNVPHLRHDAERLHIFIAR